MSLTNKTTKKKSKKIKENKNAKNFVEFLLKNHITTELLPIYHNDKGHAIVVLTDKTDTSGYSYNWEVVFDDQQDIAVAKTGKLIDNIKNDLSYCVLEILNEKNKLILWGKFFMYDNSVHMATPIASGKKKIHPEHILKIITAMRSSINEVHNEILKTFI